MTSLINRFRSFLWPHLGSTEDTRALVWTLCFRSSMHFMVGTAIAGVAWLLIRGGFPPLATQVGFTFCWTMLVIEKELKEAGHQPIYKTVADVLSMLGGFIFTMWWPAGWSCVAFG